MKEFTLYKRHYLMYGNTFSDEGLIIQRIDKDTIHVWDFWWPGTETAKRDGVDLTEYKYDLTLTDAIYSNSTGTSFNEIMSQDQLQLKYEGDSLQDIIDHLIGTYFAELI